MGLSGTQKQRKIFWLILFTLPFLFFLLFEITLQIIDYGGNLNLFITVPGDYTKYYMCNPRVTRRYFAIQPNIPDPPNDIFLKEKPDNCYRIFMLGGSTTAGYPYEDNVMFSRILQRRLQDTFPDKYIEIVNTATAAINSYTLLDFTDEIFEQKPDALLIYAGHNEYYGALGVASAESLGKFRWFIRLYLKLKRYKIILFLRDSISKIRLGLANLLSGESEIEPSSTLMERLVAEQKIALGSTIYELGKMQFRENLSAIIGKAKENNTTVLVSELVSNIRDQKPFVSMQNGQFPAAADIYKNAKSLEHQNKFKEAQNKYYLAKDLDGLRFRASEEFNDIINLVATEYGATVVPMKSFFESSSPHGLIGNNLMLEHLHPNISGYFLMADAFFETMKSNKFIASEWDESKIKPVAYYRDSWGVTALDSLSGDLRIRILKGGWPFKARSLPNRALIDYNPRSKAESLAVKIWKDKTKTIEHGHVELAEYYLKKQQYDLAYQEYNALISLTPANISPYLGAANALIKAGKYKRALPLLHKSLSVEETAFSNKWIGQINLSNNQVSTALPYLERAYQMKSSDLQLLYNLSGAYALNAQYDKAKETIDKLYAIAPNFPAARELKANLERILKEQ
jgi:tetratricopeptide (TPR) repeat protein